MLFYVCIMFFFTRYVPVGCEQFVDEGIRRHGAALAVAAAGDASCCAMTPPDAADEARWRENVVQARSSRARGRAEARAAHATLRCRPRCDRSSRHVATGTADRQHETDPTPAALASAREPVRLTYGEPTRRDPSPIAAGEVRETSSPLGAFTRTSPSRRYSVTCDGRGSHQPRSRPSPECADARGLHNVPPIARRRPRAADENSAKRLVLFTMPCRGL